MQIQSVLLLVLVGAVAVLAKKGSSEEKDRPDTIYNVWPYPRPARGPPKFKPKKHQPIFIIGGPEYPNNGYQQPQFPPQEPQGMNPFVARQYIENLVRQMEQVSVNAYTQFQIIESEIDQNKKNMESYLLNQFNTMQSSKLSKQAKEIEKAVKGGKDSKKMENCFKEKEEEVKQMMEGDVKRTSDCITDASERARKTISDARNAFTELSVFSAMQVKQMAQEMSMCIDKRDVFCAQQKMAFINQKGRAMVAEAEKQVASLRDLVRNQMIQLDYCRQNFLQDLREMRAEYSNITKDCVSESETQKPVAEEKEEEDEEEDEDEYEEE